MTPAHLIRFAMLTGVLLFGGVTWLLRRSGEAPPALDATDALTLVWMGRIAWLVAIGGSILVFALLQQRPSSARIGRLSIVAWALGELVALYGGVVWFLTGSSAWYLPGLVFLVLSFLAFPARRM